MEGQGGREGPGSNPDQDADYENVLVGPDAGSNLKRGHGDGGPAGDKKPKPLPRQTIPKTESNQGHVGQDGTGTEKQDVDTRVSPVPSKRTGKATNSKEAAEKALFQENERKTSSPHVGMESQDDHFGKEDKKKQSDIAAEPDKTIDMATSENLEKSYEFVDKGECKEDDPGECEEDDPGVQYENDLDEIEQGDNKQNTESGNVGDNGPGDNKQNTESGNVGDNGPGDNKQNTESDNVGDNGPGDNKQSDVNDNIAAQSNAGKENESDSDLEVLPEEQSADANKSFESIQPPVNVMVASVVDEGIKEVQTDANKPNTPEKGIAEAKVMPESSTSTTEKKEMFTLKKLGKKYLIKCSSCPKPFTYTPISDDLSIDDEDNLLIDGDRYFTLMVVDGMIILDEVVDAGQTNTTPIKNVDNLELQDAATSVSGMPSTGTNNVGGQSPTINNSGEKNAAIKNPGGQNAATNNSDGQNAATNKSQNAATSYTGGQNAATKNSGWQNATTDDYGGQNAASNDTQSGEAKGSSVTTVQQASDGDVDELIDGINNMSVSDMELQDAATSVTGMPSTGTNNAVGQGPTINNSVEKNAAIKNFEEGQNAASNDTLSGDAKGSSLTTVQQASDRDRDKSVPLPKHPEERIYLLKGQESSGVPNIHVFVSNTSNKSSRDKYYTFGCKKMDTYLRWMLAVKNATFFEGVVSKLPFQQKYGFKISTNNSALLIVASQNSTEEEAYGVLSKIVDVVTDNSRSYIPECIECTKEVYSGYRKSKLANDENFIIYFDKNECQLWMLYHPSIKDQVESEKAKKVLQLKPDYYVHNILDGKQFKVDFESSFSTVEIYHKTVPQDNAVVITLRCQNTETLDLCKKWICEYADNIASLSENYSDKDGCSAEIMKEYLNQSISSDVIRFEVNGIGQTVWMWSASLSQSDIQTGTRKVRSCIKNGRVVKSLCLPKDQRHIVETLLKKYGKSVQVEDDKDHIVVSGLCYAVDEIEGKLRKNNGQQDQRFGSSSEKMGEPYEQSMDRGAEGGFQETESELKWNKGKLETFACHSNMVMVTNIPKDKTEKDLENELIKSSINKPLMVYLDGSGKALLIRQDNKNIDVDALKATTKYKFTTEMALGNLSMNKDINWKKLDKGSCDKLENILNDIKVTVDKATNSLKAETTYQMQVAKHKMKQFFEDKEKECTIDGVTDIVWKITSLVCKQTIDGIERKGCKFKYDAAQQKVFLPAIDKPYDTKLKDIRDTIANMQSMEFQDVQLTPDEAGKCDNICKEMGDKCCIFDRENNTVYIYSATFDKIQKFKTQFEIKIGRKKATARGKRNNATVVDVSSEIQTISPVSSPGVPAEPKDFKTIEGVKVMVYKANILTLDVDCIVNAANSDLNHGGGVARVIAKAAGDDFEQDCKGYIRRNKKLPVGQACSTTAGNLKYKYVIHTVGPQWWDYSRKPNGKEMCEDALKSAILSSIEEANRREMKSIAFPAISSAIFGVPLDICAKQYVEAVKEYSRYKNPYDLCEVHFIDVREETVRAMQNAFSNGLQPEESNGGESDATAHPSDTSSNQESIELPEPLMFEEGLNTYNFYFMGNSDKNMLCLQHVNIEQINDISCVVVPVDKTGKCGMIGSLLERKVEHGDLYKPSKSQLFRSQQSTGSVLKNSGYGCGFTFILYAVYPIEEKQKPEKERESSLAETVMRVLRTADEDHKIKSVVVPMFGIDSKKDNDVQMFASVVVKTYREFCDEKFKQHKQSTLTVCVACHDSGVYNAAKSVFVEYVMDMKESFQKLKSSPGGATAGNPQPSKESDDKSLEVCVICMDTVTVPKTIDCGHTFCKDCIDQQFQYQKKCPTCGKACGIITGDQPYGTMEVYEDRNRHLPGYEGCGTIIITYRFNNGTQESHHPSPGKWYKGITRSAYLPNNEEGRKVQKMLRVAFDRKLTFTIGNSRTTGQEGVITWNDIHHKTDHRHHSQFGYPDPTYLERVKDELAAKGITEEDIKDM